MNSMCCSLPDLPTELVEMVAYLVEDKEDLLALRLTCSDLCRKTQTTFIKIFYNTIETSLSVFSIQRLKHIAQHKNLREQVQELCFVAKGTDVGTGMLIYPPLQRLDELNIWRAFGRGYEWRKRKGDWREKKRLRWDCPAIQDLCSILTTSFIHCRSFRIGPDQADWWKGDQGQADCITSIDVFAVLLRVIALTGIEVRSFALESRIVVSRMDAPSPGNHYLPEFWEFGMFQRGWGALQSLDLEMNEFNFDPGDTSVEQSAENNARIISAARNLKRLRLAFEDAEGQSLLLEGLCTRGFARGLETLVLKLSEVKADALKALLSQPLQDLKTLVFHDISLLSGTWQSIFSCLQDPSRFPKLNSITIASLRQMLGAYPSWSCRWVSFQYFRYHRYLPPPFDDERFELLDMDGHCKSYGLQGIRYRGDNISAAIDVLKGNMDCIDYTTAVKKQEEVKEKDFKVDEWRW